MNNSRSETNAAALSPDAFVRRVDGLMSRLCRGMVRHEQNYLTRGELTVPQFWTLEMLHREKTCRMHDLVDALQLKPSTGTIFVDRLVALGLVRRDRSTDDRRAVKLALTARGTRAVEEIHRQRRQGLRRLFAPLSARERADHLALLEKLARALFKE